MSAPEGPMTPDEAAAYWLIRRDQGAAVEDDTRFTAWLAASRSHAQSWERAVALWESFEDRTDPLLEAMRQDALAARRTSGHSLGWTAIAASVALLMVAGVAGWQVLRTRPEPQRLAQIVPRDAKPTFVTGGAPATFALPDGSLVTLNANAALAVRYTAHNRAVRLLHGEAYFSVVHDSRRPFTTDAGGNTISDLGTDFDVLINGRVLSVTLIKGSVAVITESSAAPKTLKPGQRLHAAPGKADLITIVDLADALPWRTNYIELHDEPLEKAIAQVNRYGGAPARITDPSIRNLRVSGRFRTGDPSRFARTLAVIYPLRIVPRPDGGVDIQKR